MVLPPLRTGQKNHIPLTAYTLQGILSHGTSSIRMSSAILPIGGEKTGKDRRYEEFVPIADRLYDEHLETLRKEGLIDGS